MAKYRVRHGHTLAHNGTPLEAGARVELPRGIAEDMAIRGSIEEIDDKGNLVEPMPVSDLDRFRTHERVGVLRERLKAAQDVVVDLQAQLAAEEQRLIDEVKAVQAVAAPVPKAQPKAAEKKE